jgi:DNA-directed RNA polymerase specialized sigma24 family protein
MNDAFDHKRIRNKVRIAATKLGFQKEWEDIAQEILTRMLEGKHKHATVDQAVIDYIRKEYGSKRYSSFESKNALAKAQHQDTDYFSQILKTNPWEKLNAQIDFKACIKLMGFTKKAERAAIYLKYKMDWNHVELSDCFGVSEVAISQYFKIIETALRKTLKNKERKT